MNGFLAVEKRHFAVHVYHIISPYVFMFQIRQRRRGTGDIGTRSLRMHEHNLRKRSIRALGRWRKEWGDFADVAPILRGVVHYVLRRTRCAVASYDLRRRKEKGKLTKQSKFMNDTGPASAKIHLDIAF